MGRSTQLEAQIADELFNDLKTRVEMLGDYAQKLFSEPEKAPEADCAPPDASLDGQAVTQLFIADGTDENDAALARRIGIAGSVRYRQSQQYAYGSGERKPAARRPHRGQAVLRMAESAGKTINI